MKHNPVLIRVMAWWCLALLFLIPVSLHYLTLYPFAISWLNLLSVGFIGLGIINYLIGNLPYRPVTPKSIILVIVGLIAAMAWALLFTHPLRNGIGLWTSRLLQPLLVGFFVYQLLANESLRLETMIQTLFWSLVLLIAIGGLQASGVIQYSNPGRLTDFYQFPNTFARYIVILLMITLPWILIQPRKTKYWYLGGWILGVALLLGTKSYGGVLSFFTGLLALFLFLPEPYRRLKRIVILSLIILAALIAINAPKLPKWQTTINDSRNSRLEYWHIAAGVIRDHFWTGIGIKTWETDYLTLLQKFGPLAENRYPINWNSPQPHDVFLDSFVKAGFPGFLAITALLLWPIVVGYEVVRQFETGHIYWWFGLSMLAYGVAMITFGIADDPLWSDDTMPLLFILYLSLAATATIPYLFSKRAFTSKGSRNNLSKPA